MSLIYEPSEDSYFLKEILEKYLEKENKKIKIFEMGIGSGIQLETLKKLGFENLSGVDLNGKAVERCKKDGFDVSKSNLFSKVKGNFDLIIFNPPYLPKDKLEDNESSLATTGGKKGSELINKFLFQAKKHLEKKGKIILLVSSLTKEINLLNYKKKKLDEKKIFFEKLEVWELSL